MQEVHVSSKHRRLGVPATDAVANLFPDAPKTYLAGKPHIILPHDFVETKMLRNIGFEVPAPVLSHYDWAGGTPFDVQRRTVAMMTTNQRGYVLNGMGTGKTKCALWAFDYLKKQGLASKMLVCAPLSTLRFTWEREAFSTVPHLKVGVLHGSANARKKVLHEDADIYIINPDGLGILEADLAGRTDIDVLCLDELATFRNGGSKRNKIARRLAAQRTWVWGLTGSPTPNEPSDAWGQCQIVTPHTVDRRFTRFRDEVMEKRSHFTWVPKRDAKDKVFLSMQPAVRFTLDDVVELPDVVERAIDVPLGPQQEKVYKTLQAAAMAMVSNHVITAANAGVVLSKLLQVSMGHVYSSTGNVKLDATEREQQLFDIIESTDRKVLVFIPFTHALEHVMKYLQSLGVDVRMVHGKTPHGERSETFRLFQSTDKVKVIVAHPATMSHGLTLTAADTIVWYGPTTSLETFEQANARIRRVGQKHRQQVLMLQSTAAERKIYKRLRAKQNVQNALLDMFSEDTTEQDIR